MKFYSTRDPQKKLFSLADAAFLGLAPDGGLFVPERIPQVDMGRVERLAAVSYADMAAYLAFWKKSATRLTTLTCVFTASMRAKPPWSCSTGRLSPSRTSAPALWGR